MQDLSAAEQRLTFITEINRVAAFWRMLSASWMEPFWSKLGTSFVNFMGLPAKASHVMPRVPQRSPQSTNP